MYKRKSKGYLSLKDPTKIRYCHIRVVNPKTGVIQPKGGLTCAYQIIPIQTEDAVLEGIEHISFAVAYCKDIDLFCYKTGRAIAAKRLLEQGPLDIIPLIHPISEQLAEWCGTNYFDIATEVWCDEKGRWLTYF